MRKTLRIGGVFAGVVVAGLVTLYIGEVRERHQRCDREREIIAPVLSADPAFGRIEMVDDTAPGSGLLLLGPVATSEDRARLRAEVVRKFGEPRADAILMLVYAESELRRNRTLKE